MDLIVDNRQKEIQIDEEMIDLLKKTVLQCLKAESRELDCEVSISFVDDNEIRLLNKQYRGIDKATDVLSFSMLAGDEIIKHSLPILLGDIVISVQSALRQSNEFGHTLEREIAYLTVHSMLHLLGYDHLNKEDKKRMREREKEIMKLLGIFKNNCDVGV